LEKEAQKRANAVTDEQEQAAEALMTESIRYADMSKKERKAAKEEMQQAVQELTKEESDEQA
jgi:sarcosine oxidase gamma subunit